MTQARLPRPALLYLAASAATAILYLGWTEVLGGDGYPLDDAWIHQTLARNLARQGQWAYQPGQPTAASTSPLWTLLLVPGHLTGLEPRVWTLFLGLTFLFLSGWWAHRLAEKLFPGKPALAVLAGAAVVLEWHLAWAALSGMETSLFIFLSLLLLERTLAGGRPASWGLVAGLLTLTRPEGAALFALIAAALWLGWLHPSPTHSSRGQPLLEMGMGFAALIIPYLGFHLIVADQPLPNTFYAKHREYQEIFAPLPLRPLLLVAATLVGGQILLAPGLARASVAALRKARMRPALLWWAGFLLAYSIYLPLTYQHGRYVIPTIPILVVLGVGGTAWILQERRARLVSRTFWGSLVALWLAFWVLGARAYAEDVRIIDTELVAAARWVADNSPSGAVVGAHDIGAIGYFSERRLVDTAGLESPEVIPFIRDESRLLTYLEEKRVDYFVSFPSWYPRLVSDPRLVPVYRSPHPWSREAGGEQVVVYETRWDPDL